MRGIYVIGISKTPAVDCLLHWGDCGAAGRRLSRTGVGIASYRGRRTARYRTGSDGVSGGWWRWRNSWRSETRQLVGDQTRKQDQMMGYVILFGGVYLAGMLGVKVGELAGRLSDLALVASLTSFLLTAKSGDSFA